MLVIVNKDANGDSVRVLSFDPGAKRMGYAMLVGNKDVVNHIGYGHIGVERGEKEKYQPYRQRLIAFWVEYTPNLIENFKPDIIVSEIVPPVGGGAFASNGIQAQLAMTAITTVHAMAIERGIPLAHIGATTVKTRIGGDKKASKVKVRNGVYISMPETKVFHADWKTIHDVSDAFAIALTHLGFDNREDK